MPNITLQCDGTLVDNITNYQPENHIKMHPPGLPNVSSTVNDTWISWSPGRPVSDYITSFDFQVEVKRYNHMWREAKTFEPPKQELRIPAGQLTGHQQVRVRVRPNDRDNSHWSDWSPTASWVGPADRVDASDNKDWWLDQISMEMKWLMFTLGPVSFCLIVVILLALYRICKTREILKEKPVPNPSKYFHTLHSVHGGDLKNWLNPLPVSELFFMAQPRDQISSVEVCEVWDVVPSTSPSSSSTNGLLHFQSTTSGVGDTSSSSSCFSNMGYFMSSSSGSSARTDPNPAYFAYKEDFQNLHGCHNLPPSFCPSFTTMRVYEGLKREPHSPDSGFGIGREDENEDEVDMDVEAEHVLHDQSSPLLVLPLHLPFQMCPPSSPQTPPHPPSGTPTSSDSQQVDAPVTAAASANPTAWLVAGAMCRSSSMPVEPCKTDYLTLKELQSTFSNKSI